MKNEKLEAEMLDDLELSIEEAKQNLLKCLCLANC